MENERGNNHRFLELVRLDASYKERIALLQSGHQQIKRLLKLRRQGYHLPLVAFFPETLDILSKERLQKLILCRGKQNLNAKYI